MLLKHCLSLLGILTFASASSVMYALAVKLSVENDRETNPRIDTDERSIHTPREISVTTPRNMIISSSDLAQEEAHCPHVLLKQASKCF